MMQGLRHPDPLIQVPITVAQPKLSLWGRGALHRQVVYEPNVQEETLTAEAADSPDLHCTARAVQPRTTTNTVFP